ncbi:MAG TPA: DUF2306 domain-containing protein [Propionibacteriaceae bacterium]|nr:DUF2306 domain-containing protein [Propionibacteriaceae bacterium]
MITVERSSIHATPRPRRPRRLAHRLAGLGWVILLLVCLNIVVVVSRYLTFDPQVYFPQQRQTYLRVEFFLGVHVLSGIFALLIGPFQFVGRIRRRFLRVHRLLGMVYVASATAVGLTGLVLAPTAYTGLVAVLGFTFLDLAMLFTTWTAVRMVVARRIDEHRRWMIRSFSLILAGVMLRVMVSIHAGLAATGVSDLTFETAYAAISWLCWVPNLLVALWVTRRPAGLGASHGR